LGEGTVATPDQSDPDRSIMSDHPVLPDLSPAKALWELWRVGFEIAAMFTSLLTLLAMVAFGLGGTFLGTVAIIGVVLCVAVMLRLRLARKDLEDHRL
jgi:hypothetical protein